MIEVLMLIAVVWIFRRAIVWITLHLIAFVIGAIFGWRLTDRG
ncbi:hypothetical protein [Methylorubrum extorquens]|uniref:Uncharacterized protein n=1 Tax=Methylorubrum extorquens (strain CM4 / NCIMB 13688) TaxID=440085 RepID=B7KRL2_METC4|nr:hypothetical protein [Methylorubrum extorquens]ACK85539.1 hypothetical protein Mchl_4765 [Methylorubrum extorquens CM4]